MIRTNELLFLLIGAVSFFLVSCSGGGSKSGDLQGNLATVDTEIDLVTNQDVTSDDNSVEVESDHFIEIASHEEEGDYVWNLSDEVSINLAGSSATASDSSVVIDGSTVQITSGGTYRLIGPLYDGQILVNTSDDGVVRLILDGVDLANSKTSPLFIEQSYKTILILEDGTLNSVYDSLVYEFSDVDEDEPNSAIFSKDNLTIYGNGRLTIDARYNDGIASKDGLLIKGGNITINAEDDGIRGKDYLIVEGGVFTIVSNGDGLKSTKDDEELGYISISAGQFSITSSSGDAITAETNIQISGGNFTLLSGTGSNSISGENSTKGLKAGQNLFVEGGVFSIDSSDDAIHSNNGITINDGTFNLLSSDDGIHADVSLTINNGNLRIEKSYEGIESAAIVINGGNIYLNSNDDGINVAGGVDGSGGNRFAVNDNNTLDINGGYVVVDADGDGLDSNGHINMSGGTVIVHGPTANFNGPLDFDGDFYIEGGLLIAVGSSQMAESPTVESSQFTISLRTTLATNTLFDVQDSAGNSLATFRTVKPIQSIVFSTPNFQSNEIYSIYTGGASTGINDGGLYTGGNYSPGSLLLNFSFSNSGIASEVN